MITLKEMKVLAMQVSDGWKSISGRGTANTKTQSRCMGGKFQTARELLCLQLSEEETMGRNALESVGPSSFRIFDFE